MRHEDLETVLSWRNHPETRKYMLTRHEISVDEHRQWFENASSEADHCLLIFEANGSPAGFVHFRGFLAGGIANWGFHVAPGSPKGTGTMLGASALDYAFESLEVHKVCGQALDFNEASIRLHQHLGFVQEGVMREQHLVQGAYCDLILFGLLGTEWPPSVLQRKESAA
ncbi:MAG: UDP-4-amino-4,6-dideoxy-N-acetyl-beta-L-altrosamine N-acetyltransferase [Azoarcus sp.]|nr:UDP-4-amino-4,6-dideoxy-N-acetyl-beta-L-altrosamine N-acetyltransferase [Azoarcus sp.]